MTHRATHIVRARSFLEGGERGGTRAPPLSDLFSMVSVVSVVLNRSVGKFFAL
jgi:hypothetical protein